jgi:hypothetical protein
MTYERLESMSLLELALWKVNIDGYKAVYDSTTDHGRDEESSAKRPSMDKSNLDRVERESAALVISNVLPFSDRVCREDYITS